jgi:manganese efflux pump family protein
MDLLLPVLIGIALSMDCFAVSLAIGTATRTKLLRAALIIAFAFGFFQTGMTLLGWAAGAGFAGLIAGYDHWVAFILLAVIGGKMIHEGQEPADEDDEETLPALRFVPVIVLSFATSIDALAVGLSFALLRMEVLVPALIIGIVAFLISFTGVITGLQLKSLLGKRIEILGGLILILIGLNILVTHLSAA